MSIKKIDSCEDFCQPDGHGGYEWSKKGTGFGQFYFYYDEDGNLHCSSECMSRKFIKEMLCIMVDNCIFDDEEDQQ